MIEIRKLSDCPLSEATQAWNAGFEGYVYPLQMDVDAFTRRFALEALSPSHSLLLYVDGQPAGIMLNGIKELNGEVWAWNGGTGIAPAYRGQGIGKHLMDAAMQVYREAGAQAASLEVLMENESAIRLYERYGYERVQQELYSFEHTGALDAEVRPGSEYMVMLGHPSHVADVPFYDRSAPWSAHWQNLFNAESLVVRRSSDFEPVCYALFKRTHSRYVPKKFISLSQLVPRPGVEDADAILQTALSAIFSSTGPDVRKTAGDLAVHDPRLAELMAEMGFAVTAKRWLMFKRM